MAEAPFLALVVDDEPPVRGLTVRALNREGFRCDVAGDGREADAKLAHGRYDLVVADLRMPNKHGHALALDLLNIPERPLVLVLTGCCEPRLARDLLARGVDDVFFKPVDFALFAAKARLLATKRKLQMQLEAEKKKQQEANRLRLIAQQQQGPSVGVPAVGLATLEQRLASMSSLMPISPAALDVFKLTRDPNTDAKKIAKAMSQDAPLCTEVVRLANSGHYNPGRRGVANLDDAVTIIGYRRLGEVALAASAMATLSASTFPWLDTLLMRRRSVAAGVAGELLIEKFGHQQMGDGVVLCSLIHGIGRIVLGSLFQEEYVAAVDFCRAESLALRDAERQFLPVSHSAAAARLLAEWGIPPEVYQPLHHLADAFESVSRLVEPIRSRVELIKLAAWLGRVATNQWESYDWVDLPPTGMLDRLRVHSLAPLVERIAKDVGTVIPPAEQQATGALRELTPLPYFNPAQNAQDLVPLLLRSLGYACQPCPAKEAVLVNCFQVLTPELERQLDNVPYEATFISNRSPSAGRQKDRPVITLPCSYAQLESQLAQLVPALV